MVVSIHKTRRGWSFAGNGPGVRVRLPKGSVWKPVIGEGMVLFVQTERMIRTAWSAAQVAEAVEAGRLKLAGKRRKLACAKEAR